MRAVQLKTNHLTNPVGMDGGALFLSWQCEGGKRQSACEIILTANGEVVWESGRREGSTMHASVPELPQIRAPRVRGAWRVRLFDEDGNAGPWAEAFFETGLWQEDWKGVFVNPEPSAAEETEDALQTGKEDAVNAFARANWEQKEKEKEAAGHGAALPYVPHRPASYIRKRFQVPAGEVQNARLYITAKGLYIAWINGKRVGDMVLAPGSFTGNQRLGAQTYDVTALLREGENELLAALGDGWHRSTSGVDGDRNLFGETVGLLFQLEADGQVVCVSDADAEAMQEGPIRQNDLQQGEVYDARKENNLPQLFGGTDGPDKAAGAEETVWHSVTTEPVSVPVDGMNTVPIREQEAFEGTLLQTPNGEWVLDFGQNLAGYIEIRLQAREGERLLLTCGETLDENGNFTQENFQERSRHKEGGTAQLLELICREGENHFRPHFTIMGFRYARVEADMDLSGAVFTAHAVYSDMQTTGHFACGIEAVNQLVRNSIWSQKSNFCDIPTDCPTRERAGWTGDMGVFIETGLTLMDCYPVVRKWLSQCRQNQYPDGRMANIAPPNSRPGYMTPMLCMSSGWGDASILVPYAMYQRTGDLQILEENYEMMQRWYAFLFGRAQQTDTEKEHGRYARYTVLSGMDYGEWCEPGITPMQAMSNPRKSVGTAYLAYSGRLLAEIAELLGRSEDAAQYRDIAQKAQLAYREAFTQDGRICSDRQCEYVRPAAFSLLSEEECQTAADTLDRMVKENGYHLNTGFLSTPYLCPVLTACGHTDTAYRLLLQEEMPGWLYAVRKGATTVWETWDGIDEEGKVHASLNHYSYGAVCGFLFSDVCGIHLAGEELTIAPKPDPSLGFAEAAYDSPVGRIESRWRYEGGSVIYTFTVPSNVTARIQLPGRDAFCQEAGTLTIRC